MHSTEKRSAFDTLDNVLLVVVAAVVGFLLLQLIQWVVGTIFFVVKLALVVAVVAAVWKAVGRRADRV